jgi:hypothetical protein
MYGDDDPYLRRGTRSSNSRLIAALVLLAFAGGLAAMAWIVTKWDIGLGPPTTAVAPSGVDNGVAAQAGDAGLSTATAPPAGAAAAVPALPETIDQRTADLEARLARIAVSAQMASGYANRAEAIMVAFAARRALDAGTPLGYLEGQLRFLFGEAQPKAVATIVNAASDPVTTNKLRAGLEDIQAQSDQGSTNDGWWSSVLSAFGSLAEIRHASAPSPEPEQRLARARRAVEAGQIESAIGEVAALPPQPAIAQWLEQARRYNEARRALDVVEAAAILEPRAAPLVALPVLAEPATADGK